MKIPITKIDLDEQTIAAAVNTLKSGQWILGKKTQKFESEFAKFCKVKHAICVSSGTTALFLSLKSLGVKKGDEVIVPSFSFIATASAVSMCGGIPKFVDINEKNFTINPFELENKIVGIAHYRTMPRPIKGQYIGFLDDLFIEPDFRGQKIAQKLISHLKTLSKANNWDGIRWITHSSNKNAKKLYDKISNNTGFELYELKRD